MHVTSWEEIEVAGIQEKLQKNLYAGTLLSSSFKPEQQVRRWAALKLQCIAIITLSSFV